MNPRIAIIFAILALLFVGSCSHIGNEYSLGGAAGAAIRELGAVDIEIPAGN